MIKLRKLFIFPPEAICLSVPKGKLDCNKLSSCQVQSAVHLPHSPFAQFFKKAVPRWVGQ